MPIADKKKAQDLINEVGHKAQDMQACAARLGVVRQACLDQNVDTTGTPLEGNEAEVGTWITDLAALSVRAVAVGCINNIVESHTGNALGV